MEELGFAGNYRLGNSRLASFAMVGALIASPLLSACGGEQTRVEPNKVIGFDFVWSCAVCALAHVGLDGEAA